ncbi:MAG: hypothetical protein GY875_21680 [Gammaproteobacteria bacterium]|nr:hypothetical protein [Gammaproteobacteria bacterium]
MLKKEMEGLFLPTISFQLWGFAISPLSINFLHIKWLAISSSIAIAAVDEPFEGDGLI